MMHNNGDMRVLYLPLFEPGSRVQKRQKRGLRDALKRHGEVVEIDWLNELDAIGRRLLLRKIGRTASELDPTLVLCQFHDAKLLHADDILALRKSARNAQWVNWNRDYRDFGSLRPEDVALASAFDLQLCVSYDAAREHGKRGIRARYWQIGWEPEGVGHDPRRWTPRHDVLFQANLHGPKRLALVQALRRNRIRLGLYGKGWPSFWAGGSTLYDFRNGCRLLRAAKVVLGDSLWPRVDGFVSNRLFQSLAAGGALVLQQRFKGLDKLGLAHGRHLIVWREVQDLLEKIRYWLRPENDECRRAVAAAGQEFCLRHHSFDVRVIELLRMLRELRTASPAGGLSAPCGGTTGQE